MAKTAKPETRLADAAFRLLAKQPWSEITLIAVARVAKVPLGELHVLAPSKTALIGLMLSRASEDVGRRYKRDRKASDERDRILDVSLTWFEALDSRKAAIAALHDGLKRDPLTLLAARRAFVSAAQWLLVLAEADTGRALPLKAVALAAILTRAVPVWLEDDAELANTMAKLDAGLRRANWLL